MLRQDAPRCPRKINVTHWRFRLVLVLKRNRNNTVWVALVCRIEILLKCEIPNANANAKRAQLQSSGKWMFVCCILPLSWQSNCAAALSFVYSFWHAVLVARNFGMQSGWKFIRLACLSCLLATSGFTAKFNLLPCNRRLKLHLWYSNSIRCRRAEG